MSSARSTCRPGRPAVGPPRGHRPDQGEGPRRRRRATYHHTGGVRHLFTALKLGADKTYRHARKRKETRPVPRVLPLPARPPPAAGADRDRLRQLRRAAGGRRFRPDPDIFPGHRGRCGGRGDAAGALGSPAGTTPNWTSTAGALVMRLMVIVTAGAGPGRGRHRLGAADTPAPGPPPGQWAALAGSCFAPSPRRSP